MCCLLQLSNAIFVVPNFNPFLLNREPSTIDNYQKNYRTMKRTYEELPLREEKRRAAESLSGGMDVCSTRMNKNYAPDRALERNGSVVEVEQVPGKPFIVPFAECQSEYSDCQGINDAEFTSLCETMKQWQSAYVRELGSSGPFRLGTIQVHLGCQCKLFPKTGNRHEWNLRSTQSPLLL
uniref:Uncharacterized protein n=1 Tax=Plectus sambesii TaxID=2011161 RepID=A0A914VYN6_9BILA